MRIKNNYQIETNFVYVFYVWLLTNEVVSYGRAIVEKPDVATHDRYLQAGQTLPLYPVISFYLDGHKKRGIEG